MSVRAHGLALLAGSGIAITLAACSSGSSAAAGNPSAAATASASHSASATASPTASTVAQATPAAVPSGYRRIGSATQGISVAVPASWVSINPAEKSLQTALDKLGLPGTSSASVAQELQKLQSLHAVYALDVASAASDPGHFARNINAYCVSSGVNDTGSAGIPYIKEVMKTQLSKVASGIKQQNVEIGGVPGVKTSYQLDTKTTEKIDGSQLEVLPKPDTACFVTLTTGGSESQGNILAVVAATAEFL